MTHHTRDAAVPMTKCGDRMCSINAGIDDCGTDRTLCGGYPLLGLPAWFSRRRLAPRTLLAPLAHAPGDARGERQFRWRLGSLFGLRLGRRRRRGGLGRSGWFRCVALWYEGGRRRSSDARCAGASTSASIGASSALEEAHRSFISGRYVGGVRRRCAPSDAYGGVGEAARAARAGARVRSGPQARQVR
jgi:hypothetical protein